MFQRRVMSPARPSYLFFRKINKSCRLNLKTSLFSSMLINYRHTARTRHTRHQLASVSDAACCPSIQSTLGVAQSNDPDEGVNINTHHHLSLTIICFTPKLDQTSTTASMCYKTYRCGLMNRKPAVTETDLNSGINHRPVVFI